MLINNLKILQKLYSLESCVVVGSGTGSVLALLVPLKLHETLLLEADPSQIEKMHKIHQLEAHTKVQDVLIYKDVQEQMFYRNSLAKFNCFRSLDSYKALAPNAHILETLTLQSYALDTFLVQEGVNCELLVIESFAPLAILEHAKETLKSVEVLLCSVLQGELETLVVYMQERGFTKLTQESETNPELLQVLFVFDHKEASRRLKEQNLDKTNEIEIFQSEKLTFEQELKTLKDQSTQKAEEIEKLNYSLKNEKTEKENVLRELEQVKAHGSKERETLTQEKKQVQVQLEEQKSTLQEKEDLIGQLAIKRDALTQELQACKKRSDEKALALKTFLNDGAVLPQSYLATLSSQDKTNTIASFCIRQDDILDAIDSFVLGDNLSENEKFDLCCAFAQKVTAAGDKYQGVSFLNNARYFFDETNNEAQYKNLIELASTLNHFDIAVDLEMEYSEKYGIFSVSTNQKIFQEYRKIRSVSEKKQAHGHDLLIDYIQKHVKDKDESKKVLVEVGTTRENIPGQGSTMQLAKLCKRKNIKFITVDMDPHNTRWANFISSKLDLNIEAVTKKGEEYLRDDIDSFDFVFLDAYDFDHGGHSKLRQSRYEKNLGSKIDEEACHVMHLECAKSVVTKLKEGGIVCVDDTWKNEKDEWIAKGTLAIPYLLDALYQVISNNNNAILLNLKGKK